MKRSLRLTAIGLLAATLTWGAIASKGLTTIGSRAAAEEAASSRSPWIAKEIAPPAPMPRLAQRDRQIPEPSAQAPDAEASAAKTPAAESEKPRQGESDAAPAAPPATPEALTLADLEQIALECNPTLVQASMQIRAAEGTQVQEGLYPNPTIAYVGDEIGSDGSAGFQGGFVSQEIVTAGKLRLRQSVAGHQAQEARHGWVIQQHRVLNDVRAGFYDALLAQRTIEISERLLRISQEGLTATEQLRKAQEVGQANVLEAQVEADRARLNVIAAQNRYWGIWRRLAAVLGRPGMEPVPLAGSAEEVPPPLRWEDIFATLLSQSPELAQARAGVERARCEVARQCAERVPNFQVLAGSRYDTAARDTVADVQVSVPLPLFNRNQGNILRAQADLIAAQNEVRRIELDLHERLANVFEHYTNARQQVEVYAEKILPNAQKSLDLTITGYRQGEFDYLALLTAQRTYFSATLNYVTGLRDLHNHRVDLEGLLLRGGLQQLSQPSPPIQ